MPLVRYEIRNEYNLANPELYGSANKDDPQVLLEGVSMAGLVGIVRQLGDLAEFAAEVFHDLHEVLMATASRSHGLMVRVQQLEAEFPSIEKSLMYQNNQLRLAYIPSSDWHASIRNDQNHLTQGDLPRFILNSYEECRSPPRLFLLDKFDIAGAGACLKRYTDPSFFKLEWASSELMKAEKIQREKKARKRKGRRRRNGETSDITQSNARVRYSSLDLDNSIGGARSNTVSHHQVLKSKLNIEPSYLNTYSRKENGHMFEKPNISNGAVHLEPEVSYPFQDEAGAEKPVKKLFTLSMEQEDPNLVLHQVPSEQGLARVVNRDKLMEQSFVPSNSELESIVASQDLYPVKRNTKLSHMQQKYASATGNRKPEIQASEDDIEDVGSEVDSYMDALATIELETELNSEEQTKPMSDIEEFDRPKKKSIMHSEAVDTENSAFYNCDSYDESLRLHIPSESLSKKQLAVPSKSELIEKLTYDSALSHYPTDSYHGRSPVLPISVESSNDISVNMFEHGVSQSSVQKSNEELQSGMLQYHSIEGCRNLLTTRKESNNSISAYRSTHGEDVEMEEPVNENIQTSVSIFKGNLQSEALDHVRLSVSEKQQTCMSRTDQPTQYKDDMDLQPTLHEELPDETGISTKDTVVVELQPGTFEVQESSTYTTNLSSSFSISEIDSDKLSPLKQGDNEQSYLSSHSNEQLESYQFQASVAQNFSADLKQNYSHPQSNKDTEYAGCLSSNICSSFKTSDIQFNTSGETAIYSQENGANKVGYSNDTEHAEMDPRLLKSHKFAAMIDNPSDIQAKVEKAGIIQIKKSVENVASSATLTNPNISLSDGISGNLNANLSLKTVKVNSRKEFQGKEVHLVSDESGAPSLSTVNDGCEEVIHDDDELSTREFSSRDSVVDRSVSTSSTFNPKMSVSAGSFKNIFDKKPWSEHDETSLQMFKSHTRQKSITGTETHLIKMIRPVKPAGADTAAEPLMVSPEKEEVDGEPSSPPLEHVKITFESETDSPLSLASISDDYFQEFSLSQEQNYSKLSMAPPSLLSSHTNIDSGMMTVKQYHEQGQFHIFSNLPMESSEEIAVYSGRTIFDNADDTDTLGSSPSSSSSLQMENISNLNLKSSRPEAGTSPSQLHNASLGSSRKSSFASLPHYPESCIKDVTDHCNQSSSREPSILVSSSPTPEHVKEVFSPKLHSSPLLSSIELYSSTIRERLDLASPEIFSPAPHPPPLPLPLNTKNGPQNATDTFAPYKSFSTERKDSLIEAIASHDKSMLKKIPRQESNNIKPLDDREVLLEQIRTQSFNLRRTPAVAKQHSISRPVTNINVAAILEKANAIRQAYEESDEDEDDDDWSDS